MIDKNSYTKITIDQASKIGCTKFWFAKNININEIIKPNSKLPLSPRNNFGRLKIEKLKNRKIIIVINKIIIKNLMFWFGAKKSKIIKTDIDVKLKVPSIPSK